MCRANDNRHPPAARAPSRRSARTARAPRAAGGRRERSDWIARTTGGFPSSPNNQDRSTCKRASRLSKQDNHTARTDGARACATPAPNTPKKAAWKTCCPGRARKWCRRRENRIEVRAEDPLVANLKDTVMIETSSALTGGKFARYGQTPDTSTFENARYATSQHAVRRRPSRPSRLRATCTTCRTWRSVTAQDIRVREQLKMNVLPKSLGCCILNPTAK